MNKSPSEGNGKINYNIFTGNNTIKLLNVLKNEVYLFALKWNVSSYIFK